VPSSGADIITQHWTGIETHIDKYVGYYVQAKCTSGETKEKWEVCRLIEPYAIGKIQRSKRTDFDATIASGYAIMAVNRKPYMALRT
jgi:hypothetical protein